MVDFAVKSPESRKNRKMSDQFNHSGVFETSDELILQTIHDYAFMDPPIGPDEIGWIAHYRVIRVLGEGGMGTVFEAEDTHLKRPVALKVMKTEFVSNYSSRERFLLEARAAAALESDHIVTIYQVGTTKDVPYLAMQLLHGEALDARLEREAPLPMAEAILIARQIAEGLKSAHDSGLVHRDIKPANVWLESDEKSKQFKRVKLLDFGLARKLSGNLKLTNVGMIVGTPQFMSPEQASGLPVDCRSDLFSLGSVLYTMLTGRLPFTAETAPGMLIEIVTKEPPTPSSINRLIPQEIDDLIARLMAKSPEERPNCANEVADALDQILTEYSFLTVGRSTVPIGSLKRNVMREPNLNRTAVSPKPIKTAQIPALPVFVPVDSYKPGSVPTQTATQSHENNPFSELEIDLGSLPWSVYDASHSRSKQKFDRSNKTLFTGRRRMLGALALSLGFLAILAILLTR